VNQLAFHFFHHLAAVRLHRDLANAELAADLLFIKPVTTKPITCCSRR
jgi:hypothetical protein